MNPWLFFKKNIPHRKKIKKAKDFIPGNVQLYNGLYSNNIVENFMDPGVPTPRNLLFEITTRGKSANSANSLVNINFHPSMV
jgi:hypothetical protein